MIARRIELHEVQGDRLNVLLEPNVKNLARQFAFSLASLDLSNMQFCMSPGCQPPLRDDIPLTNAGSDARVRLVDQSVVDSVSIALAPDLLAWAFFLGLSLLSAAIVFKGDRFQTNIRYNSAVQDVISNCAGSHGNLPTVQDCKPGFRRNLH